MPARNLTDHDAGHRLSVCAPLRCCDGADRRGARARLLGRIACSARCLSRVRTFSGRHSDRSSRASLPSKWRNSSPSRWKMRSMARQGLRRCVPSRFRVCRSSPSRSRTASTCMSPGRGFQSGYPSWAAVYRRAWAHRNSLPWCRAPWICSRSACCRTRSMPSSLRDTADWIIKPRLLAVPGVAHVIVFGGERRQIQILPNVQKLASFGITFNDVSDAARAALPLRGAGFIDVPGQRSCCDLRRPSRMSPRSARRWSPCAAVLRSCCAMSPR